MSKGNLNVILFCCFAVGLPLWGMQTNNFHQGSVHACTGSCYEIWKQETGGAVAIAVAQAQAKAEASPVELGEVAYAGCISCHGSRGEGGIGPALAGQKGAEIYEKLVQYKQGETRGAQSALMWSQSAMLSDDDMNNLAAFVEAL